MTTPMQLMVPAQNRDRSPFSGGTPAHLEAWLEELPRGDPRICGGRLLDSLWSANRAPLTRMSRFELAEALRPVIYDTADRLIRRYHVAPLPLSEETAKVALLVSQLLEELAIGFKLAVNDMLGRSSLSRDDRLSMQIAMQRSLLAHGRCLLEAYRTYAPEPEHIWRAVHMLYRNAEALRLQAQPIEGTRDSDETALSIKQAYMRLVLLALANPYHLMQGEAEEIYRRLGRWVHFVRVITPSPEDALDGRFVVDLDSHLPPRYASRQHRLPPPANPRVFGVEDLLRTLAGNIRNLESTLRRQPCRTLLAERMQLDMYNRLYTALAGRNERKSPRRPSVARVRMTDGLAACHYFLNERVPFSPGQAEPCTHGCSDNTNPMPTATNGNGVAAGRASALTATAEGPGIGSSAEPAAAKSFRSMLWSRKNESDGGMALFCPQGIPSRTRVGELVAYTQTTIGDAPGKSWAVGVIRWMRTRAQDGVEIGIQHLADSGYAATAWQVNGSDVDTAASSPLCALITPRVPKPENTAASLVTPPGSCDVGNLLRLTVGGKTLHVELEELLDATRFFARFRYSIRKLPPTIAAPSKRGKS